MHAGLGLHDLLAEGPQSPAQLAVATGADAHKLRRLLRFLVGRGLFQRVEDAADGQPQFANNELSNHLRKCETLHIDASNVRLYTCIFKTAL